MYYYIILYYILICYIILNYIILYYITLYNIILAPTLVLFTRNQFFNHIAIVSTFYYLCAKYSRKSIYFLSTECLQLFKLVKYLSAVYFQCPQTLINPYIPDYLPFIPDLFVPFILSIANY